MNQAAIKILIVDDDEGSLSLFHELLELEGCLVVEARDGVEALDKYEKCQPDVVLLDLMLPRLNGYEVCQRLRGKAGHPHTPIIMLSGLTDRDTQQQARAVGVDDFLVKPIEPAELVARLRTQMKGRTCDRCRHTRDLVITEVQQATTHLQRTLHQLAHTPLAHHDEQFAELLTEAIETCNRLDETLATA